MVLIFLFHSAGYLSHSGRWTKAYGRLGSVLNPIFRTFSHSRTILTIEGVVVTDNLGQKAEASTKGRNTEEGHLVACIRHMTMRPHLLSEHARLLMPGLRQSAIIRVEDPGIRLGGHLSPGPDHPHMTFVVYETILMTRFDDPHTKNGQTRAVVIGRNPTVAEGEYG